MTKGAAPKEISGKYLVVWERVKGEWKLATDIWNDGK
jgi:ketosteroid isomerase-like protein